MSTSLSTEQLTFLGKDLLELKDRLEAALSSNTQNSKPVELDLEIGRLTRMDAIQQQHMAKAGREANRLKLKQIEAALLRLENETYGECISCGENIAFARLKARPESQQCVECKERKE